MRAALLLAVLAAGPARADYPLPAPPPTTGYLLHYEADRADFDGERSILRLTGNVTLKTTTMTVKGQDFWIDNASQTARSDKPFFVEDGASAVYGESGEFDFAKRSGRLARSSTGVGDWRIHSRQARLKENREVRYVTADFTSCDQVPPHYHFHASSLKVVPNKYLLGKNTLFYLGKVPVFYTPFFYKSLDPVHTLKWRLQPGYDRRNGYYVKGTLMKQVTPTTYAKLYDDYYSNMGWGLGGEVVHQAGEDSRGSLFGYRIHENATVNNRWGYFGGSYKSLSRSLSFQGRLQFQSDASFTNHYVRSDIFRLTPQLINSAALTNGFSWGTMRLIYSRLDVTGEDPRKFVKASESIPRVEAQGNSFRIWKLPWLNTLSGFAENNYTPLRMYDQRTMGGTWSGTRSFNLARGVSFTPNLTYSEIYYNRVDSLDHMPPLRHLHREAFIGRWSAAETLRFKTPLGDIDATHVYAKRLRPNTLVDDTGPADRGVETNAITLRDIFTPAPRMWARVAGGYDFATYRDRTLGYQERIRPITTDVSWQSSKTLIFTLHYDHKPGDGNRSVIGDVRWNNDRLSVGGGMTYNLISPGTYYQSLEVAYSPSTPTWRVSVGLYTLVVSPGGVTKAQRARLYEKEVTWTRRWHDFYTKLIARVRPGGIGEITGRVDFRFGGAAPGAGPTPAQRKDWESEWFPGRARESEDLRP